MPETFEASLQLGGRVLEVLGASDDAVAHRLASMRDQFEEAIRTGAPLQDEAENVSRAQRDLVGSTCLHFACGAAPRCLMRACGNR